jgi:hypothetical protein
MICECQSITTNIDNAKYVKINSEISNVDYCHIWPISHNLAIAHQLYPTNDTIKYFDLV